MLIDINYDKCRGIDCLECLDICPMQVFSIKNNVLLASRVDNCCRCEVCVDICVNQAIKITY